MSSERAAAKTVMCDPCVNHHAEHCDNPRTCQDWQRIESELSRLQQENENEKKARLAACKLSQIDQERAESAERELKALREQMRRLILDGRWDEANDNGDIELLFSAAEWDAIERALGPGPEGGK